MLTEISIIIDITTDMMLVRPVLGVPNMAAPARSTLLFAESQRRVTWTQEGPGTPGSAHASAGHWALSVGM